MLRLIATAPADEKVLQRARHKLEMNAVIISSGDFHLDHEERTDERQHVLQEVSVDLYPMSLVCSPLRSLASS